VSFPRRRRGARRQILALIIAKASLEESALPALDLQSLSHSRLDVGGWARTLLTEGTVRLID
jgi:hypothetical protein